MFVASPFYLRAAISAFEAVDPSLTGAARTLGAGPGRTFFRVALPLAAGGLGAGWALAFARGIGEFGATIMFAGSLQGVTQTLSLAVYEQFDVDFDVALAIGAELVVVSAAVLLAVKLVPSWTRSMLPLDHPLRSFRLSVALELGRETLALVGPSGAGKSSVLRAIAGPAAARAGEGRARGGHLVRQRRPQSTCRPSGARSGSSSRSTRSSRTSTSAATSPSAAANGSTSCSSASGSRTSPAPVPAISPAASGNASRSPVRSRATRRCCCSTSRSRRSTRTRAASFAASSPSCSRSCGCRR